MNYWLGVIAFLVIPLLELAFLVVIGIVGMRVLVTHIIPNAGKIGLLEFRVERVEQKVGIGSVPHEATGEQKHGTIL